MDIDEARSAARDFLREDWQDPTALADDTDLFRKLRIDGDDVDDFFRQFSGKFGVDMSGYRWYFHAGEEVSLNFGSLFVDPPNKLVERIPITLNTLAEAIQTRRWPIEYPAHELPPGRWDMRINLGCMVVGLAFVAITLLLRFFH